MRGQHFMVGLWQAVIFHIANGFFNHHLPQLATNRLRHPSRHNRFISRCTIEIFRQHPYAAPRRNIAFFSYRALRHLRGDIHCRIADANHQHFFAAQIMRRKRRVIAMRVHLNAVEIIAIFGWNFGIPMMAIGHHQRAILTGLTAR